MPPSPPPPPQKEPPLPLRMVEKVRWTSVLVGDIVWAQDWGHWCIVTDFMNAVRSASGTIRFYKLRKFSLIENHAIGAPAEYRVLAHTETQKRVV